MTDVVLLCGVAGAGKTTYARTLEARGYLRLSYDEEMWALGHDSSHATREVLDEADRRVRDRLGASVGDGVPVVLDASLSTRAIRDDFRALVRRARGVPRLVVVDAPFEVLVERMRRRLDHADANNLHLDERSLRDYVDGFEFPGDEEPHELVRTG
ncbi:ATP-binding protein [Agromyces sp. LHK192]|uniref:AAA family ATPase n=1 Tax=Agromyces sp. LHK192 TaxID=2498704 RepID=UPI000FD757B6|nr:ATP-binding protein [Agromyces sp. LHK192]